MADKDKDGDNLGPSDSDTEDEKPEADADQKINGPDVRRGPETTSEVNVVFRSESRSTLSVSMFESQYPLQNRAQAEEGPARAQWANSIEFLMSCISMSVGLGNIWRFPFTAFDNGGGAFLIPYLIVLTVIGRPMYLLELILGQFTSSGPVKVWEMVPLLRGVGYGGVLAGACTVSYYAYLLALATFYLGHSFSKKLPWQKCDSNWDPRIGSCAASNMSASEMFYKYYVLKEQDDINDGIGVPDWRLTLCLLGAWIVICATLIKGISSSGKVAYFTATFPYVVLLILLIRGVTLKGAGRGIIYFLKPQWAKLAEAKVWFAAIGQCFFSLGPGFGCLTTFGSFNPFKHNVYRDTMIVSLMDTFTSLLAGITIFAILGNLAYEKRVNIKDVAKPGPGLAFVSYPEAIAKFDVIPQLFSVLFFLMLFTLGVGSAASYVGTMITIICDAFPKFKRWIVTVVCSSCCFLIGLIYVTPGGSYLLTLVDMFGVNYVISVVAMFEIIGVAWVYGLKNLSNDIEFMLGIKVSLYWLVCWGALIPFILIFILVYSIVDSVSKPPVHEGKHFPLSALVCGTILTICICSVIPAFAIHAVWSRKTRLWGKKFRAALKPSRLWGPEDPETWEKWLAFKRDRPKHFRSYVKVRRWLRKCCSKCCKKKGSPTTPEPEPSQADVHNKDVDGNEASVPASTTNISA